MTSPSSKSTRSVVFADYNKPDGVGISIEFRDGETVMFTEFLGDTDYNNAIGDWILFGQYKPIDERCYW